MKKKIFLIVFIFLLILQIRSIVYGVEENQKIEDVTIVNPNYRQVLSKENIEDSIEEDKKSQNDFLVYKAVQLKSSYKGEYYYESKKKAAKYVKDKMVNREKDVTVRFQTTNSDFEAVAISIVNLAVSEELANASNEGDYLAWSYGGYTIGGGYYKKGNTYYCILKYKFIYYTSAEQEKELDKKIKKLTSKIDVKKESQYSIIKQVNDYICNNVEYDYEHLPDPSYTLQFTAYEALVKGKAVCQGYATLYYRILKECNVENRIIVSQTHSWNLVNIDQLYYNVDTVWNDDLKNDKYFLSGSDDFINNSDHIRNKEYNTVKFNKKYPTAKSKFNISIKKVENVRVTETRSNEVSITWDKQDNITGYKIYKYNYDKNCWEYYKNVKGAKNNTCKVKELKDGKTYKVRVRAYVTINNKQVYGTYSESLKSTTASKKTSIKSIKLKKNKQIRLGWKKVSLAKGYQMQYSTSSKFNKNVITTTIKNKNDNYKTVKNLKKGKKYYFRIRTYKTYNGKKYYSDWSKVKSIKCK